MNNIKIETYKSFFQSGLYNKENLDFLEKIGEITKEEKAYIMKEVRTVTKQIEDAKEEFDYEIINTKAKAPIFSFESLDESLKVFNPHEKEEVFVIRDQAGEVREIQSAKTMRSNLKLKKGTTTEEVAEVYTQYKTEQANAPTISPEALRTSVMIIEEFKKNELLKEINENLKKILKGMNSNVNE